MASEPTIDQLEAWKGRKPARRMAEIPRDVRQALGEGWIESKNLVEWLSVDRKHLAKRIARELSLEKEAERQISKWEKASPLRLSFAIGGLLAKYIPLGDSRFPSLSNHRSDVVREWSSVMIGCHSDLPWKKKLAWMKPLADDHNPGVREIAWMSLRHQLIADLERAIEALIPWTGSRRENLRRYASEITRPCGVWAAHIPRLKEKPEIGLSILEPLRADDSKYVRDSVANWLNDASKSRSDWVVAIAARWKKESICRETELILKRGLRTLEKSKTTRAE